jgi:hypothetical protein
VLEQLGVGLCTAACKLTLGCSASASGASIGAFPEPRFWARAARCREGQPSAVSRGEKSRCVRGSSARSVCSGSVLVAEVSKRRWAQRSHFGCGRGGGRGPSFGRGEPSRSETASGNRSFGYEWSAEGSEEDRLLMKGVLGSWKPSAFTGCWWNRFWLVRVRVSAHARSGDSGRQSFGSPGSVVVNSRDCAEAKPSEASRVA